MTLDTYGVVTTMCQKLAAACENDSPWVSLMPPTTTLTGSQLISRALKLEGVNNVFTLAGDHVLPALDAMTEDGFRFIDTRHEQAAVHMADTWARITGEPGVSMYTTPGFANAIPGLSNAYHSEAPVLSISGSAPLKELGRGAMQEIDQVGMAAPTTKGAWLVADTRRIPQMIAHALRVAYSGRRGPVHLTIPVDIQQQEVRDNDVALYGRNEYRNADAGYPSRERVREAVDLLSSASRPLVIAGSAAVYSDCGVALQKFIETTRLPLMTEGNARGLVPDDHPYCFGFFDTALNRAARLLRQADVVMLLGRKQDIILGYAAPPTIAPDARIVQVDPSPAEIGRNRGVAVGMVGQVASVIEQMTSEAEGHLWKESPWLQELQAERDAQTQWLDSLAIPETPMHAVKVHKTLQKFLRRDDCLVFDGGDFCHFARALFPAFRTRSWLYVSPSGMIGTGLPTALAAKLAYPDRRVILLTGDGSFGFNAMEFDTAVRHNLSIVAVMGNDAAWGIDRQIQLSLYGRPTATDLWPTRYDQVVVGLGGHGEYVQRPEELAPALERAFAAERPALLNVEVQRAISPRAEAAIARGKADAAQPF